MSRYRDHMLFLGAGMMVGFVLAYLAYEHVGSLQPQRPTAGAQASPHSGVEAAGEPSDPGQAIKRVEELAQRVQANPNDADALLELGGLNIQIGNWQRGAELLERRLALRPGEPDVIVFLGVCYRGLGQFDKALELFDQALAIAPDHLQALYYQTVVLAMDLQRYDAARQNLDQLRRLQPGNPDVEALAAEIERRRNAA